MLLNFLKGAPTIVKKEEEAYMFFTEYLDSCKELTSIYTTHHFFVIGSSSEAPPTLGDVLSFFTGEDCIPSAGYPAVTLNFNQTNVFPTSSTCAIVLTLPTRHESYEDFKKYMDIALTMHGGFGLI